VWNDGKKEEKKSAILELSNFRTTSLNSVSQEEKKIVMLTHKMKTLATCLS